MLYGICFNKEVHTKQIICIFVLRKYDNIMARVLTGVQSTGTPHLGNILGAIKPAIEMAHQTENDAFIFIADLHSLTQIKDAKTLRENTYSVAASWLAFGLDPEKVVFYRQSDVTQTTELTDRKSTRLNSSHVAISYAVFCLKKK